MWQRIRALIVKEIYAVWQDKKSRIVLVMPPMIQLFVFSFAGTLDVTHASIGILNRDAGYYSYELIQRLRGSPVFTKLLFIDREEQMEHLIDAEEVMAVVQIDDEFSKQLLSGQPANVQVILDGRRSNTTQILQGYIGQIIDQFQQDYAEEFHSSQPETRLVLRNFYNPNLIYTWFTVPGLVGTLTLLIGLMVTALSVAREKEMGTFEQLLVSPLTPFEILVGKAIPGIIIGMGEGSLILLAAVLFFGIPFTGSLLSLYFSMFVFISSIVGVGLLISSLCSTQQQAILGVFVFVAPAIGLSGFATPVENMPEWLQTLTLANPLRHFLVVVRGVFLKAMPLHLMLLNTYPMALIAAVTLSAAGWFFRRRLA